MRENEIEMNAELVERLRPLWDASDVALRRDPEYVIEIAEAVNIHVAKREAGALGADSRRANKRTGERRG